MRPLSPARVRRLLIGLINQVVHEREDLRGIPTHEGNEPQTVSGARAFLTDLQAADPSAERGYPFDARVWFRESTGAINDTHLTCRHAQSGELAPEEVPGLPALHGAEAAARAALGPVLDWYQPDEHADRPLADLIADAAEDLASDRAELLALRHAMAEIRDRTGEAETRALAERALQPDRPQPLANTEPSQEPSL
ncbi:MAG: hypothetical protein NXI30_28955 [bacterium]|nr:hypothetical protein [bacterium]